MSDVTKDLLIGVGELGLIIVVAVVFAVVLL